MSKKHRDIYHLFASETYFTNEIKGEILFIEMRFLTISLLIKDWILPENTVIASLIYSIRWSCTMALMVLVIVG